MFDDDFFGGMFDFNGDGKTTIDESFLAYNIFVNSTNDDDKKTGDFDTDSTYVRRSSKRKPSKKTDDSDFSQRKKLPENPTKKDVADVISALKISISSNITTGLLLSAIPAFIFYATIKIAYESDDFSDIFFLLFFGGGLVFLGVIWSFIGGEISQDYNNLNEMKEKYNEFLTEEELSTGIKKKRKRKVITVCAVVLILSGILAAPIAPIVKISRIYKEAVSLVDNCSYEKAEELFKEIEEKDYRDTAAYISLCKAHYYFDIDCAAVAYQEMKDVNFYYLTSEQKKAVNDFKSKLKTEYDKYLRKKYEEKPSNGHVAPYVLMPESEIAMTDLGTPTAKYRDYYEAFGSKYVANIYTFYHGSQMIFKAYCVNGKVVDVEDHIYTDPTEYSSKYDTYTTKNYDPYNVNDYSNEEDFYYDHYDDFYDYYDAENYYRKHHD